MSKASSRPTRANAGSNPNRGAGLYGIHLLKHNNSLSLMMDAPSSLASIECSTKPPTASDQSVIPNPSDGLPIISNVQVPNNSEHVHNPRMLE